MSVTQFTAVTLHFKSAAAQEYSIMPKKQEVNMAKVTSVYFVCATPVRSQLLSFADFFFIYWTIWVLIQGVWLIFNALKDVVCGLIHNCFLN